MKKVNYSEFGLETRFEINDFQDLWDQKLGYLSYDNDGNITISSAYTNTEVFVKCFKNTVHLHF